MRKYDFKTEVIEALRDYINAEKACVAHPQSVLSSPPPPDSDYLELRETLVRASMELWHVTDCEYSDDGFRNFIWEWRYWSVMSRKCSDYILTTGKTDWSGETMRRLHEAEYNFAKACGLEDLYEPPCVALKKHFPNLGSSSQEAAGTTTTRGSWWTVVKNWFDIIAIAFSFGPPF